MVLLPIRRNLYPIARAAAANLPTSPRFFTSTTSIAASFDKVGVIGLGLMGHGIAQVAAQSGVHSSIVAYEPEQKYLDSGRSRIEKSIAKLVGKGKLSEVDAAATNERIVYTTDVSLLKDADFIVEAVIENMDLKRNLYKSLDEACQPSTIFASNTSSLSITEMAQFSGRTDRFVGIHFFNPVQLMKLVEVISTAQTDPTVYEQAYQWVLDINKVPVKCGDTPGFIVNRLLVPALMQAMLFAERGDATVADIDISMQLGAGHPMGPLHLADYIGLDTCLFIVKGWVEKYPNEPAFVVPKILEDMVAAGNLGRKTGRGFYHWEGDKRGEPAK